MQLLCVSPNRSWKATGSRLRNKQRLGFITAACNRVCSLSNRRLSCLMDRYFGLESKECFHFELQQEMFHNFPFPLFFLSCFCPFLRFNNNNVVV